MCVQLTVSCPSKTRVHTSYEISRPPDKYYSVLHCRTLSRYRFSILAQLLRMYRLCIHCIQCSIVYNEVLRNSEPFCYPRLRGDLGRLPPKNFNVAAKRPCPPQDHSRSMYFTAATALEYVYTYFLYGSAREFGILAVSSPLECLSIFIHTHSGR